MTDEQWQQLEKYVRHVAGEQTRDYIKQLIEEKEVGKEEKMQQNYWFSFFFSPKRYSVPFFRRWMLERCSQMT